MLYIRYMQIFDRVPRGGASNDSGVVVVHNFHCLLLAVVMFSNFRHDMQDMYCMYRIHILSTAFQ